MIFQNVKKKCILGYFWDACEGACKFMLQKMQLKLNWFSEEISEKKIQYVEQKEVKTKTNGVSLRWFFQTCFFIKNKLLFMLKMFYKCFLAALFYEEGWWFKKIRSFLKDLRAKSCFFHYFFKKKVLHILYHGSRMGAVAMRIFFCFYRKFGFSLKFLIFQNVKKSAF